ncbi:MAG: transcriptional regulator [Woeseiaceae bacterium]|nr:transcriptional regulator [Woeseiaceae bacterium]
MAENERKLVTIVTEAALETELCESLLQLGASGYTVTEASGSGSRGVRDAGWSSNSNVRVEVVCSAELAAKIADHVRLKYYDHYAMILFEETVRVLRPEKFP